MSEMLYKLTSYEPKEFALALIGTIGMMLVSTTGVSLQIGMIYLMYRMDERKKHDKRKSN